MPAHSSIFSDRSVALPVLTERHMYVLIGALMILTLQFQTLPFNIPIQTLPLTTVIALLALPFVLGKTPKSPLLMVIFLFTGYAFLHSVIAVVIDMYSGYPEVRFIAWVRQFVAFFAGVVTFYVFRVTLTYLSLRQVLKYVILGSLPALFFSMMNVLWGALKIQWLGTIVIAVREFISSAGYTSALRASGFTVEPAHLATIIVVLLVPTILIYIGWKKNLFWILLYLAFTVIVFVWTFSLSGLILMFVLLLAGMVFGPLKKQIMALVFVFFAFAMITLVLFPSNQVFRHARSLAIGQANLSMNDRVYGVIGPFLEATDSWTMVGYGLGGVSSHFDEVVPKKVQSEILSSKWKEYPTISSLFGRVFAEMGAIGLVLFLIIVGFVFWELQKLIKHTQQEEIRLVYTSIRLALIAVFTSLFITIGPYHTPYFWFWIAVVDAQFVLLLQNSSPYQHSEANIIR